MFTMCVSLLLSLVSRRAGPAAVVGMCGPACVCVCVRQGLRRDERSSGIAAIWEVGPLTVHRGEISFLSIRKTLIYGGADRRGRPDLHPKQTHTPHVRARTHGKDRCLCAATAGGTAACATRGVWLHGEPGSFSVTASAPRGIFFFIFILKSRSL